MGFGFPQVGPGLAAFTPGAVSKLPLLAQPSGDGETAILQVGGITATVGFPYGATADAQTPIASSATAIVGLNAAGTLDRIRVAPLGTALAASTPGVLVVQGSSYGAAVPIGLPYASNADAQTTGTANAVALVALNPAGALDRIRVANAGVNLGAATPGLLVVQGSSNGTPIPITGSFSTTFPYSGTSDAQAAGGASAVALVGYNGATYDRLRSAAMGTAVAASTAGILVVQSSPNAAPFPIAPVGAGALFPVPAGTTDGTVIGSQPAGTQGIRIYVPPSCTFTYTIAASAPGSAPTNVVTFANTSTFPIVVDENLSSGQNIYVTAPTSANAALVARWI